MGISWGSSIKPLYVDIPALALPDPPSIGKKTIANAFILILLMLTVGRIILFMAADDCRGRCCEHIHAHVEKRKDKFTTHVPR